MQKESTSGSEALQSASEPGPPQLARSEWIGRSEQEPRHDQTSDPKDWLKRSKEWWAEGALEVLGDDPPDDVLLSEGSPERAYLNWVAAAADEVQSLARDPEPDPGAVVAVFHQVALDLRRVLVAALLAEKQFDEPRSGDCTTNALK